ncbi:2-oxoacid:ferredoxin oxidoreductase subunit beta [Alkaliphilus peptidifermentans]|uniref:2-oxoglutarate ferredoxin oxidoreductase, beta subunit n=1 Tax=Alkaliphilus peptidifermentans DSM 18978 TaxID=1120976 RepID=A0A1G5KMG6_9FIRM|nr:2-oxoacid:ferredoxin oxidoreductase subunit beta [Alkaliphilus peptidifermentans]SCZ01391.1 2-oxoglutarate ferredoxin oxidoreductase, beta subunit [Alkaliphilus peptidifermentans DSM 18978]
MSSQLIKNNFRNDRLPHIWCPGCGHGIIMKSMAQAIENLNLDKQKVCVISGIGCSSRAPGYLDFNTLHTTHGRALAFATGVKLANPELKVIVVTGDGDCTAIGGNHLIHTARRNIDITTIVFNNNIYGMTGGQYSPTTPTNDFGTTAPFGNIDKAFDICKLAEAAGATYTARGTAYHANQLTKIIENALKNNGFSLVDAISICPTYYGRKNKKGTAVSMMNYLKDFAVDAKAADKLPPEKLQDKFIIGEFKNTVEPEYTEEYMKIIKKYQKER